MNRRIADILDSTPAAASPGAMVTSRRSSKGLFSSLRWYHVLAFIAIAGGGLVLYARSKDKTPAKKKVKFEEGEEAPPRQRQQQQPRAPSRPSGIQDTSGIGGVRRNSNQTQGIYEQARLEKIKEEEYRRYKSKSEDAQPRIEASPPPPRPPQSSPVQPGPSGVARSGMINGMSLEQLRAMKK